MPYRTAGNTLSEYAIMLGLLTLLALGAIRLLGVSTTNLYHQPQAKLTSTEMNDYVSLQFGAPKGGNTGNSPATNGTNVSMLGLNNGTAGGINATSVDGTTPYLTANAATRIEQLSLQISDPEAQSLAQTIATMLYGTTLSQGFLSNVPGLSGNVITSKDAGYSKTNALRDIYNGTRYAQTAVKKLAKGPLANDPVVKQIIQLANTAISKAKQDYPLDEIARIALNSSQNASLPDINRVFFNGQEGYTTKQSTINDLSLTGANPLPEVAKTTVKSMVVTNRLTPYTTVKVTGEAAVTSDLPSPR